MSFHSEVGGCAGASQPSSAIYSFYQKTIK